MTKLKNSNCDKTKKKIIFTKLKNWKGDETKKNGDKTRVNGKYCLFDKVLNIL